MRIINSNDIAEVVKGMCIKANCHINKDIKSALSNSVKTEKSDISKGVIENLLKNAEIADSKEVPICQDTGMAVFFIEIGNEVFVEGDTITDAVNKGVSMGYTDGYLRKSVVRDPLDRVNTKDNTPAVIYYDFVKGDKIKITFAPKGFGSENMSQIKMLTPSKGIEGVKQFILDTVFQAGPNPCPPMVVGVGIGGTFEKCALMAKKALLRTTGEHSEIEWVSNLEKEVLQELNQTGIGPGGLGGTTTVLAVHVNTYPTHIAGLPVAVNICCHVNRHAKREL